LLSRKWSLLQENAAHEIGGTSGGHEIAEHHEHETNSKAANVWAAK